MTITEIKVALADNFLLLNDHQQAVNQANQNIQQLIQALQAETMKAKETSE